MKHLDASIGSKANKMFKDWFWCFHIIRRATPPPGWSFGQEVADCDACGRDQLTMSPSSMIRMASHTQLSVWWRRRQEDPGTATKHTTSLAGRLREWWLWWVGPTSWSRSSGRELTSLSSWWRIILVSIKKSRNTYSSKPGSGWNGATEWRGCWNQ